jgi:Fe-Mn family superoxide dismutase
MSFELPKLSYAYDALEPHVDARTMEIHHSKHHQGYTNNLNAAIAGTDLEGKSIAEILGACADKPAVRNNGGGFYNHTLFWEVMSPSGGGAPSGDLASAIDSAFGSFEDLKKLSQRQQQRDLVPDGHGYVLLMESLRFVLLRIKTTL